VIKSLFYRRVHYVVWFTLSKVRLLGSEYGARSGYPDPPDKGFSADLVMFHAVEADEGAGAAETCFTVDGYGAGIRSGEVLVTGVHELGDNFRGWSGPIHEDHVVVGDPLLLEGLFLVLWFVQSDDTTHIQMLEYLGVA